MDKCTLEQKELQEQFLRENGWEKHDQNLWCKNSRMVACCTQLAFDIQISKNSLIVQSIRDEKYFRWSVISNVFLLISLVVLYFW